MLSTSTFIFGLLVLGAQAHVEPKRMRHAKRGSSCRNKGFINLAAAPSAATPAVATNSSATHRAKQVHKGSHHHKASGANFIKTSASSAAAVVASTTSSATSLVITSPAPEPSTESPAVPVPMSQPAPASNTEVAAPAPVPAPEPASTQAQPAAAPVSKAGKRGLGFQKTSDTQLFGDKVTWGYNWWSGFDGQAAPKGEYVPMLQDGRQGTIDQFKTDVQTAIKNGATAVLGMNEPDCLYIGCGQADMSPADAAALWKAQIEPLTGIRKVAPAVTNGGGNDASRPIGLAWLQQFQQACQGCTFDAFALHIYDAPNNLGYFQNYLSDAAKSLGKPIWVTEWGFTTGDEATQTAAMQTMLQWMDGQDFIERYAYEGAFAESKANGQGLDVTFINQDDASLTNLGKAYNA